MKFGNLTTAICGAVIVGSTLVASISSKAAEIVIGAPISQSGSYAFLGVDAARGMILAAEEVNARGELGSGHTLRLVVEDDGSEKGQAITLANKMIVQHRAIALIGGAGSALSLALSAVANDQQIPFIGIGTAPQILTAGPWSFRLLLAADRSMADLSAYVERKYAPKKLASASAIDNEGTVAQVNAARNYFKDKITVMPPDSTKMAESDFTVLATKLAYEKPDAVVVSLSESATANLIAQARQAGISPNVVFFTSSATASPDFIRIGGKPVEGTLVPSDYFLGRQDKLNQDFVAAYRARFNADPSNWAADGYTEVKLIANAVRVSGTSPSRASVREALEKTRDFPAVIGAGTWSAGPNREPQFPINILVVKDGKFALAQ